MLPFNSIKLLLLTLLAFKEVCWILEARPSGLTGGCNHLDKSEAIIMLLLSICVQQSLGMKMCSPNIF